MNCPLCIDRMLVPNHRGGIEIDVCPNCHGIWLDRGELDKLVEPVAAAAPSVPPQPVAGRPVEDSSSSKKKKSKKKKKKSSLGDRLGDILEDVLDL